MVNLERLLRSGKGLEEKSFEERLEWLEHARLAYGSWSDAPAIDCPRMVESLTLFLEIPDDSIKIQVLEAMSHFFLPDSGRQLSKRLEIEENPYVRISMLRLLVNYLDDSLGRALLSLYRAEKNLRVRSHLIKVFGAWKSPESLSVITRELKNRHFRVRANALEALEQHAPANIIHLVADLLKDHSPRVRVNACLILFRSERQGRRLPGTDSGQILAEMAVSTDPNERASACFAMGQRLLPAEVPLLTTLLSDEVSSVRYQASMTLRLFGEALVPDLARCAESQGEAALKEVLRIFATFADPSSFDWILPRLAHPDPWVRYLAARAFVKRLDPVAHRDRFLALFQDPEKPIVALLARHAHLVKPGRDLLDRLFALLADESIEVRDAAAYGLILLKIPALKHIRGVLQQGRVNLAEQSGLALALARIAGETGTVHSIPILSALLECDHWAIEKEVRFFLDLKQGFFRRWFKAFQEKDPQFQPKKLALYFEENSDSPFS